MRKNTFLLFLLLREESQKFRNLLRNIEYMNEKVLK